MNALLEHLRVLGATLRHLLLTPNVSLLNVTIIGIALSLPVGGYVLLKSVQTLGAQVAGTPQLSLFLAPGTAQGDVERIGDRLRKHDAVARIEFVPRETALKRLQQSAGLSDIMDGLTQNPLPDAYVVFPRDSGVQALETLRDELRSWPRVEHVQLDSAWVQKLEALLRFGRMAVVILALLLSFALVAITFNTIRLQILTRRDEIEVAKLIGATDAFIRRPFLYFGLTQGLLGGAMAWLLISGSLLLLNHAFAELARLYASDFSLQSLSAADSVSLLAFSAWLGWLGAWFSVSQHLWRIEPR